MRAGAMSIEFIIGPLSPIIMFPVYNELSHMLVERGMD